MCNRADNPPQNSILNANPSKGFSKSSRNPLKKNLIASGIANTTTISPNTATLIFSFLLISINYSTNIRIIPDISKEKGNYFHLFLFVTHFQPLLTGICNTL